MFATENNVSNMMICAGVAEHDVVNAITVGATSATFKAISSNKNQTSQNQKNSNKIEDVSSDSAVQSDDKKNKKSKQKENKTDKTKNKKSGKDSIVCEWCSGSHKHWNCKNDIEKKKWLSRAWRARPSSVSGTRLPAIPPPGVSSGFVWGRVRGTCSIHPLQLVASSKPLHTRSPHIRATAGGPGGATLTYANKKGRTQ